MTDNSSGFRAIAAESYFRFHYDNDFFTNTDYYYTQGISGEYVHPVIKKLPVSKLLLKTRNSRVQYGISFNLFGYTPTSIKSNYILYGDRPFNGNMTVKFFALSTNRIQQTRLTAAISAGIMGPAALGKEIQTTIHQWTDNPIPKGWQHQVKNDIILNYQLNAEKKLLATEGLLVHIAGEIRAGTLQNRLSAGMHVMTGHFDNPYKNGKKKTAYYFYGQARTNLIAYDATMQGGLFNKKSPYTISSAAISRISFQADAGLVLHFKKIFISYSQSFLTKEFRTGKSHRWGGISLGFSI